MKMVVLERPYQPVRIEIHGVLDIHDAHILADTCQQLFSQGKCHLQMDLRPLQRISEEVFPVLQHLREAAQAHHGSLALLATQPRLHQRLHKFNLPVYSPAETASFAAILH